MKVRYNGQEVVLPEGISKEAALESVKKIWPEVGNATVRDFDGGFELVVQANEKGI